MKLVGLMPCRNEAWVLGLSARVALTWCDELVIGFHDCDDESAHIACEISEGGGVVVPVALPSGPWAEMHHRQILLDKARERGATHIAIVDADEIMSANLVQAKEPTGKHASESAMIRAAIVDCPPDAIIEVQGYNMRGAIDRYHNSGIWGNRWFSLAFKDQPALGWATEGYDHHHREPRGAALLPYKLVRHGQGGVMHLWGASERRLLAKHALYKISERLKFPDKSVAAIDGMFSWAIHGRGPHDHPGNWTFTQAPKEWWEPYEKWMHHLDVNAIPWQEAECRRLVAEHGADRFSGLDLFGVV